MKRLLLATAALIAITSCAALQKETHHEKAENPYVNPFYAKYLNTGSALDARIQSTLTALQKDPKSPQLHNDLGALLVQKGFAKDAEDEFERALNIDSHYYPAWYNVGLVRLSRGEIISARHAFGKTVSLKPGHAAALFQLGLLEEQAGNTNSAIKHYAKAFEINPALLDVQVNPRILDSRLTHVALIRAYPNMHSTESMQFQGAPGYIRDQPAQAPSPQARPSDIVTPAPPVTDPSMQSTPHAATVIPVPAGTSTSGSSSSSASSSSNSATHPRSSAQRNTRRRQPPVQPPPPVVEQAPIQTAPVYTEEQPEFTPDHPADENNNPPDAATDTAPVPPPPAA
jgi:tetratricopeptide (TPR) repeat protein